MTAGPTAGRPKVPGLGQYRAVLGAQVPGRRRGRDGGSFQSTPPQSGAHTAAAGAADHRAAGEPAVGPGPDRVQARHTPVHRAPGALSSRAGETYLAGPGHRPRHPPLRTRQSRRLSPRGYQETRSDPRRRGHRVLGKAAGRRNKTGTDTDRRPGYAYLHNAVDDHSRLAYTEILTDEKKQTAAGFWERANAYFISCGIEVKRVLTDNGSCYRSKKFAEALGKAIKHKRTRPYRPQTNGKVERYNRTMLEEWAYAQPYTSETDRIDSFNEWLHHYNHHRGHTSLKGQPPASRVPNLAGDYT